VATVLLMGRSPWSCWCFTLIITLVRIVLTCRAIVHHTDFSVNFNKMSDSSLSSHLQLPPLQFTSWSVSLPGARENMALTAVGHVLLCATGATVDVFNMRTWLWSQSVIPNATAFSHAAAAGVINRYGIITGGKPFSRSYYMIDINTMMDHWDNNE
jgi:hypothetical protein